MRKSIEDYERIKKTMNNNKRALSTNHVPHPLPSIGLARSKVKVHLKERPILIKYE
jgi:hypothetical protein